MQNNQVPSSNVYMSQNPNMANVVNQSYYSSQNVSQQQNPGTPSGSVYNMQANASQFQTDPAMRAQLTQQQLAQQHYLAQQEYLQQQRGLIPQQQQPNLMISGGIGQMPSQQKQHVMQQQLTQQQGMLPQQTTSNLGHEAMLNSKQIIQINSSTPGSTLNSQHSENQIYNLENLPIENVVQEKPKEEELVSQMPRKSLEILLQSLHPPIIPLSSFENLEKSSMTQLIQLGREINSDLMSRILNLLSFIKGNIAHINRNAQTNYLHNVDNITSYINILASALAEIRILVDHKRLGTSEARQLNKPLTEEQVLEFLCDSTKPDTSGYAEKAKVEAEFEKNRREIILLQSKIELMQWKAAICNPQFDLFDKNNK